MADPERFNGDPDPTFHADADPDSIFLGEIPKILGQNLQFFFPKSYKNLSWVIFSVTMI